MESFQTFISIFERCRKERNGDGLVDILKNGPKYFQNISTNDSGYVLATLFNIENGLLNFLRVELENGLTLRIYQTAVIQGFRLVEFVMVQFQSEYELYIVPTKDLCEYTIKIRCTHFVKKSASTVFKKLVELFQDYELFLRETVETFGKRLYVYDPMERSQIFIIMGAIAKNNPLDIEKYSSAIFQYLLQDMKVQYKDSITQTARFQEYFQALEDLLENFTPFRDEDNNKLYYEEVYKYIKCICEFDENTKYDSIKKSYDEKKFAASQNKRSAVELLIRHWSFFGSMIYKDYEFWQKKLESLLIQSGKTAELGWRAMRIFYTAIAEVLKNGDTAEERKVLLYFREYFLNYLTRLNVNSNVLQLIVCAYSQLAAPCKKHLTTDEVYHMYSLVARRSISLNTSDDANIEEIPSYLESLSEILINLPNVSIDQIKLLSKLGILLIKRFPEFRIFVQPNAIKSLRKSITNIGYLNQNLQQEYFYDLIYNGILWTCSHTLFIDAELARSTLRERPICYKNYMPLWQELLNLSKYKFESGPQIIKQLFKQVIITCTTLMNTLNLRTKTKEDTMFSDVALSQTAENETDFRIFINMVDLCIEIFEKLDFSLLEDWIPKILYEIVRNSYRHPMVSGFYKLTHIILQVSENYWKNLDAKNQTFEMMYRFLSSALDLICGFYHELQITCVYLILDAPIVFVQNVLMRTVPVFKIAFAMGLSDFALAACALDALELWTRELADSRAEELKEFLLEVVPSLEPYLQSKESATELLQDILKTERSVPSRVTLKDNTKTLEEFQRRILLFLGSLSSEITHDFVYKRSQDTKATWDKKDLVAYTLFFPDIRLYIHFDNILPRVVDLALSSGDRRTRICACEVLHSLIIVILGKTRDILNKPNPDRFANLYKILCPAMLKLGSDPDTVVRQLYYPTLLQLTHWLSSKLMLKSPSTIYLVDALFDGLTDESNSSLREFSGVCLKEFLDWSIKQSSDRDLENSPTNIHTIVRKMSTFALHPSTQKRIAAAVAFNHLYSSLREREEILNIYWLEIFYCFVKSSEGCNDLGIENAIGHLEKVLKIKAKVFNTENLRRRKPIEFENGNLKGAAIWLLTQCGSLDRSYRKSCMKLLESINPHVDDCNSTKKLVSFYLKNQGIEGLNSILLSNLEEDVKDISSESIKPLLRTLDCYIWLVGNKLMDFEQLFLDDNPKKHLIFSCANNFIKCFMKSSENEQDSLLISRELELLKTLTCETIVTLFSFIHKILHEMDSTLIQAQIPEFFWSQDLFSLISICVLNPQRVGLNTRNLEIMEALPQKMDELLLVVRSKSPETLSQKLQEELVLNVEKYYESFTDIKSVADTKVEEELKLYVKGLILIHKQQYLNLILKGEFDKMQAHLMKEVFDILKHQNENKTVILKPDTIEYLESILELVLTNYESALITTLINLIMNETPLSNQDMTTSQHGEYFLSVFKTPIFRGMLRNTQETMKIIDDLLEKNPQKTLVIIEELVIFTHRHKSNHLSESESLADEILKRCFSLQRTVNNFEHRKKQFMNIYRIVVRLKLNPLEIANQKQELYFWILRKLQENMDLEQKTAILDNFLICLTDVKTDSNSELSLILCTLKNDRSEDISESNINSLKAVACFQTMLAHLPLTKSVVLFDTLITFAAGYCDQLCNERTSTFLETYFHSISRESVQKSLETAYKFFMNCGSMTARFDVLRRFVLPAFQFCKTADIESFFERNAKEVYSLLTLELNSEVEEDLKRLIVSKIGSYNLFEIMFARINLEKITSLESLIAKNVFEKPEEKQLMKNLMAITLSERKTKCMHPNVKEITRLLHCAAYNCGLAIISLKEEEKFYFWAFMENRQEGKLIWEKILDCEKRYSLQQTFKEYPKQRKKLINIKKRAKRKDNYGEESQSYIYKYNLASSTLTENLDAYDFNEATLLPKSDKDQVEETMSLIFECDDFNEHECMASLCGILVHMVRNDIFVPQETDNVQLPKWMNCFIQSMKTNFNNVRLFLLKVICNTQNIFKPYAKIFVGIILNSVNEFLKQNTLNYIITDVLLFIIEWRVPIPDNHIEQAQNLLEHLVNKADLIDNRSVKKYNVEIIKMILELWGEKLKLPKAIDRKIESSPDFAIGLILTFLENKLQDQVMARSDIIEFVQKSFDNWQKEEEAVLQNCAALSLIVKNLGNEIESEERNNAMKLKINEIFRKAFQKMQTVDKNRMIKCIHTIATSYPPWVTEFFEFVRNYIGQFDNVGKAKCLEIFLSRIPSLTVEEVKRELGYINFSALLQNKILTCERLGLEIIDNLVAILNPSDMLPMAELVKPYVKSNSSELREKAYEIFMKIKNKYINFSSFDEVVNKLKEMSKQILLIGLLDTSESLHEKLLNFWTEDESLPENLVDRLLILLNQYSPAVEEVFLLYFCLSMLRLTSKSKEYDEKMFPDKLEECTFNDYRIVMHWRAKNLGSMAPLFARSLASQMSQMFSQATYSSQNFSSFNMQLLRATVGPSFEPTGLQNSTFSGTQARYAVQDSDSDISKMPDPAYNKVSKRFLGQRQTTSEIAQKVVESNIQHDEMVKEEVIRQSSVVKLYRKYRIGDFPDVQIAHSSLLVPLQELAKKDWLICKDLVVCIVYSLLGDMNMRPKSRQLIPNVFNSMKKILENNRSSSSTTAAILEITLSYHSTDFEPDLVGRVSKQSGLYSLGALYLEKYLIYDSDVSEPSSKRKRGESSEQKPNPSIYLARLYESMNEVDVVLSIFKGGEFSEKLQEASVAQAASDFQQAKKAYEEACEIETDFVKEYCLQKSFECLSQLSQWDVLDKKVSDESQGDFNNVWVDPEKEEWLLPWIFRVYLHKILKGDWIKGRNIERLHQFLTCIDAWFNNNKNACIKQRFGEEIANILMMDTETEQPELARDYLKSSLDDTRENWIRLNPLSKKLRSRLLLKLRGISNIDRFLKTLKSPDLSKGTCDLIKYWSQNLPSSNEELLPWETHMNYRLHFATFLSNKLEAEGKEDIVQELRSIYIQQKMKLLDFAIQHKNRHFAKNYVMDLEEAIRTSGMKKLEFQLSTSRCFYLLGEFADESKKKLSYISKSWKFVHVHLKANQSKIPLRISALHHVTSLTSLLESLIDKGDEFTTMLISKTWDFTSKFKAKEITDVESFKKFMSDYGLSTLKESCEIATKGERADCYFKLVVHCYDRVSKNEEDLQLIREFVSATLKAMTYGSYKAAHYFPCLLKSKYLADEMAKEIFVSESQKVETWLFIAWQAQILSHLGGSFAEVLIPIIERLIEDYPNAVMYTFRLTIEANPALLTNSRVLAMKQKLYNKPDVESFLSAMHYISQPELYLIHHLTETLNAARQEKSISIEELLKKIFPEEGTETALHGSLFKKIVGKMNFRDEIQSMENKTFAELKPQIKRITDLLKRSLEGRINDGSIFKTRLKDYSPWLQKLRGSEIEVPGQYLGDRKPLPRYHAKVGKIEPTIVVMNSLRKPIKITIVGNDAKNYSFLVKFDEDLRLDQRVQQVFTIMNKILQNDIPCGQRHLAIDTYQVIPFSLNLGLIEWVKGTKCLEDYIHFTLSDEGKRQCLSIPEKYSQWIKRSSPSVKSKSLAYKESLLKYNASQVITKMNELINLTEWDSLRRTFFMLSPSIESFMSLRHNFVTTYGTMCTAQWILGIGDRHLENTLIIVKSGRCLGIDFGLAFGATVNQCVPELMPFRLTSQIRGLLKPFAENGPLGATMVHVLRALRKEKGPLMACLDVFVHEPLNWSEQINKLSKENQEEFKDINWLPKKRIATVEQKLNGKKPSLITLEELKVVHSDEKYFYRYQDIVKGTEENHKTLRGNMKNENLTPEEQVQCLIDQATDLNILGRTWKGWQPWL